MFQPHLDQIRRARASGLRRIGPRMFALNAGGFRYELRFTPSAQIELLSVNRIH